jgi:hypothetical protein
MQKKKNHSLMLVDENICITDIQSCMHFILQLVNLFFMYLTDAIALLRILPFLNNVIRCSPRSVSGKS